MCIDQYIRVILEGSMQVVMLSTQQNQEPSLSTSPAFTLRSSPRSTHISFLSLRLITQFLPSRSRFTINASPPRLISCSYFFYSRPPELLSASCTEQVICCAWLILSTTHLSQAFSSNSPPSARFTIFLFSKNTPSPTPQSWIQAWRFLIRTSILKLLALRCSGFCWHSSVVPKVERENSPRRIQRQRGPFLRRMRVERWARGSRVREGSCSEELLRLKESKSSLRMYWH